MLRDRGMVDYFTTTLMANNARLYMYTTWVSLVEVFCNFDEYKANEECE